MLLFCHSDIFSDLQPTTPAAPPQPKHGGKPESMFEMMNQGEIGGDKSDTEKPVKKRPGRPPKTPRTPPAASQAKPAEEIAPEPQPAPAPPTPMMTQQSHFEAISDNESPEPVPKRKRGRPPKKQGKQCYFFIWKPIHLSCVSSLLNLFYKTLYYKTYISIMSCLPSSFASRLQQ